MSTYEYQIYILENDAGLIKIGITKNFDNRLKSLSGSNGGGHKIIRSYVSPYTYLYSLENRLHTIYQANRINGTEWFKGLNFDEVVDMVNAIFNSREYYYCNEVRKNFVDDTKGRTAIKTEMELEI